MLINGVDSRLIFNFLPNPDPTPSASALKKFPFSLDPKLYVVSFLTFLTSKESNSSFVKLKACIFSEYANSISIKNIINDFPVEVILKSDPYTITIKKYLPKN